MGAHPGGLFAGDLPVDGYGEDYDFWVDARAAIARDDYDEWIRHWVLDVPRPGRVPATGSGQSGSPRSAPRRDADSWQVDEPRTRPISTRPSNRWEVAAALRRPAPRRPGVRRSARTRCSPARASRTSRRGSASTAARSAGSDVQLTAEIGLWGYDPTPADPFVLNHRNFPSATMLGDAAMVLGTLVGGPGTTTIGCLGGAQVDRHGNINSTLDSRRPVPRRLGWRQRRRERRGRGGRGRHADAAAHAARVRVHHVAGSRCARARHRSRHCSRRRDATDELVLTAVPERDGPLAERIDAARAACGWELAVAADVARARRTDCGGDRGAAALGPARLVPPRPLKPRMRCQRRRATARYASTGCGWPNRKP